MFKLALRMEKLDNFILMNEIEIEIFLKKRNVVINNVDSLSNNWEMFFYSFNELKEHELKKYLEEDSFYIEGALCMSNYGRPVLSFREWDMVDQLVSYIIQSLHEIIIGEKATSTFYFPDQPLRLDIEKKGTNLLLNIEQRNYTLPFMVFCNSFLSQSKDFFKRLERALGEGSYEEDLIKVEEMLNKLN